MTNLINIPNAKTRFPNANTGFVWLVGAGPGNAELLTIKAYNAILMADVVLYDSLVDDSVLSLIPENATKEYVGKRCGQHSMPQQDICQRIVFHAVQGRKVVRLKGGDPAFFGRTHEETQALEQAEIEYSIVPGITAASGASAYSGIPLTKRDCAQSVTFTTASLQTRDSELDWQNLAQISKTQTLVLYMGLTRVELISARLIEHGVANDYPVAVIDNACTQNQRILIGTLSNIADKVKQANLPGPAIIICGEVVNHQQQVSELSAKASLEGTLINRVKLAV